MSQQRINFFTEDISFTIRQKAVLRNWIRETIRAEGKRLSALNFIFCSDAYLLGINQQYLGHDTYTDIVTFDSSDDRKFISGDIFISVERVRENALKIAVPEAAEISRVIIHGVLHLLGFKDKSKADKAIMRQKEDYYILRK